jgi:hypothetical protein
LFRALDHDGTAVVYPDEEEPMGYVLRIRHVASGLMALVVMSLSVTRAPAQTAEQLQQDLKAMKAQLDQLQQQMKKQEALINKLSREEVAPPTAAPVAEVPLPTPPAVTTAEQEQVEKRVTEKIMREIQPSLAAANKTFPSQFNPAIGLVIDTIGSYQEKGGGNFDFRSAEIGISASIDPFARGYAIFNGTKDGVEVEEAAIVTTSLPYNLTVKGGRFFADFGRLSKFHDHNLPFVNRPTVLDQYIGGESQADGVELSYLTPLSQYLTLTAGAYNKIGAENPQADNNAARPLSRFTYLGRPATFFNLNDSNSVDLGATIAYTPKVNDFTTDDLTAGNGKARYLSGADITYRYTPLSQASYRGLTWGSEVLYNSEDWSANGADEPVFRRANAWGLYSYVEPKLTRVFYPGFMFNYNQAISRTAGGTTSYSPYLTIWASEFQRIRFQYTYFTAPQDHESQFFLQWSAVLGSHAHGFIDR